MKTTSTMMAVALAFSVATAWAQDGGVPPPPPPDGPPPSESGRSGQHRRPPPPLARALDANADGVIDATEIANAPAALKTLDKNGDGKLTADELRPPRPPRGPDQDGPPPPRDGQDAGGPPPGGHGSGGFHLLPPHAQEELNLTAEQQKQVADLAAEVKAKLEKILTPEQLQQLKQMRPPPRQGGKSGGKMGTGGSGTSSSSATGGANRPSRQHPSSE